MQDGKAVQLLLNGEEHGHGHVVEKLLKRAERLECLVAFAKISAIGDLLKPLRKALEGGLKARFAIGLDFYLTEPEALEPVINFVCEAYHDPQEHVCQARRSCRPSCRPSPLS